MNFFHNLHIFLLKHANIHYTGITFETAMNGHQLLTLFILKPSHFSLADSGYEIFSLCSCCCEMRHLSLHLIHSLSLSLFQSLSHLILAASMQLATSTTRTQNRADSRLSLRAESHKNAVKNPHPFRLMSTYQSLGPCDTPTYIQLCWSIVTALKPTGRNLCVWTSCWFAHIFMRSMGV